MYLQASCEAKAPYSDSDTKTCSSTPDEVPSSSAPNEEWKYEIEQVGGQFIVRFKDYKHSREHKAALLESLKNSSEVRCLERNNAAAKYPTDFLLVEIEGKNTESIKVSHLAAGKKLLHQNTALPLLSLKIVAKNKEVQKFGNISVSSMPVSSDYYKMTS